MVNHAAFFVSHRLPIALAARDRGWRVVLVTGQAGSPSMEAAAVEELRQLGMQHVRTSFRPSGVNPLPEMLGLLQLCWVLSRLRPDIVHTASPKGNIYGGLAARATRISSLVIAISGMGYLFTETTGLHRRALREIYALLWRIVCSHPRKIVVVQNQDDRDAMLLSGLVAEHEIITIHGSGVELKSYLRIPPAVDRQIVLFPARILEDKGANEFVEAARILRARGTSWRFVMVGSADYANPSAVTRSQIDEWTTSGAVEWWGHCHNMPEVYQQTGIVCLPSYREGMPKCLLEAAAAARPVVTTDVPGCREAIVPNETGDLVPARDAVSLANTLQALMGDPGRRERYGAAARKRAIELFSIESVVDTTLSAYERMLHASF